MASRPYVYGLDIETDTTVDGLDPAVAAVVTVALSNPAGEEVFAGDEATMLVEFDHRLCRLDPGVLATWNGAAFDLPFLADRAARLGLDLGLRLHHDPTIPVRHAPLAGHRGAYRAAWYHHGHVDAYRLYRHEAGQPARRSGLARTMARLLGASPAPADASRDLSREALHAFAASDARLARVLTERRWAAAARAVDRVDRVDRVPTVVAHRPLSSPRSA